MTSQPEPAEPEPVEPEPLDGIVEVDETYVGGKRTGVVQGFRDNKTMVVGAKSRKGTVNMRVAEHADRKTLHGFIHDVTAEDAETSEFKPDNNKSGDKQSVDSADEPNVKQSSWVEGKKIGFNPELLGMFNAVKDNLEKLIEREKRKLSEYTKVKDRFDKIGKSKP